MLDFDYERFLKTVALSIGESSKNIVIMMKQEETTDSEDASEVSCSLFKYKTPTCFSQNKVLPN